MRSKVLFLAPALMVGLVAVAVDKAPVDGGVIHVGHEEVAAMFAKGGPLLATNNFKVLALRREGPGEVEVHERDTDVLYVVEGEAELVTGGNLIEARTTEPGETRARSASGGQGRRLVKGDVMVIPNGVPHWFKEVKPPFLYFMVKVSQ